MRYYNRITRKTFEASSGDIVGADDLPFPYWPKQADSATKEHMAAVARYNLIVHRADDESRSAEYITKIAEWRSTATARLIELVPEIVKQLETRTQMFHVSFASGGEDLFRDLRPPEQHYPADFSRDLAIIAFIDLMPDGELSTSHREALRTLGASYD